MAAWAFLEERELTPMDSEDLTRSDIIEILHDRLAISRRDAKWILEHLLEILIKALGDDERIYIPELGRFQVKHTPSRPGRNPKTGQPAIVPAKNRTSLIMSRHLRAALIGWWESQAGGEKALEKPSEGDL
jgi:integration host factor subunit alpha